MVSDDDDDRVPMTLGFVEKPENQWSLLRQYFPSKAGGTPAWLDPLNLPSEKSSLCDLCHEPLKFMLQYDTVYAPLPEESTYHRTLFVFTCTKMACLRKQLKLPPETQLRSAKVFRCQLPRVNSFYSIEEPTEDGTEQPLTAGAIPCNWCGTWKGNQICSGCRKAHYCSEKHQTAHWEFTHKASCRQLEASSKESESAASNSIWPEYEITTEDESEFEELSNENGSSNSLIPTSKVDGSYEELEENPKEKSNAESWASFGARISPAPDQVLRYSSSPQAKPLWPDVSGRLSEADIPKCNCGANRRFEFQVLPQLLHSFNVDNTEDSFDWATIVVYTCGASCGGNVGYKEEFAFVQLESKS